MVTWHIQWRGHIRAHMSLTAKEKEKALPATRASFNERGDVAAVRAKMDEFYLLNRRVVA